MPVHFNSLTNDHQNPALIEHLSQVIWSRVNAAFATPDKKYFLGRADMNDTITGDHIGHFVFTLHSDVERKVNEVLDIDIILDNPNPSSITFLNLRDGSSDANEYYDASTEDARLQVETVGRHTVQGDILGTTRDVFVSLFPFELTVFENLRAFNVFAGFEKPVQVGETDMKVDGMSSTFMAPGSAFPSKEIDEPYTFLLGTVESFRDVNIDMGKMQIPFVIAQVATALGVVPVAMGRDVFDLTQLKVDCVVAMNADVKANLAKESDYYKG